MKVCKKCNQTYDDSQKFCAFCGEELVTEENATEDAVVEGTKSEDAAGEGMKCHKCNTMISGDDIFCPNCGARLEKEEENIISGSHSNDETIFSKIMHHKLAVVCGVCIILVFAVFIRETGKGNNGEGGDDVVEEGYEDYEDYEEIGEVCKNNVDAIVGFSDTIARETVPNMVIKNIRESCPSDLLYDVWPEICDYLEVKTSDLIEAYTVGMSYDSYIEEESEDSAVVVLTVENASASEGIADVFKAGIDLYIDKTNFLDLAASAVSGDFVDGIIESIREERENATKVSKDIPFYFQREGDKIVCEIDENEWVEMSMAMYGIDFLEDKFKESFISENSDDDTLRLEFGVHEYYDEDKWIEYMNENMDESEDESEDESMDESESDWEDESESDWEDDDYVHPE